MARGVERLQTCLAFPPMVFEFGIKGGGLVLGLVGPLPPQAQCQLGQGVSSLLYGEALSCLRVRFLMFGATQSYPAHA